MRSCDVVAAATLLLAPALAGCVGEEGAAVLAFEVSDDVYGYGDLVIVLIRNEGGGTFRGTVHVEIQNLTRDVVFDDEKRLTLPPTARAASVWDGVLPSGGKAPWGNYTVRVTASSGTNGVFEEAFQMLAPLTRHVKVEPVSENFTRGGKVTLRVRNVGDLYVNGTGTFRFVLQFAEDRPQDDEAKVIETPYRAFGPGDAYTVEWNQQTTNGTLARDGTYRVEMALHDEVRGDLPGATWFRIR